MFQVLTIQKLIYRKIFLILDGKYISIRIYKCILNLMFSVSPKFVMQEEQYCLF